MRRLWWSYGIAVAVMASGCLAPRTAVMPGYSYGPASCAVPQACDPCAQPVAAGCPVICDGTVLRATAFGVENCVNTTGNVVAGVIAFPFHVVGGVAQHTFAGLGRIGACAVGCSQDAYHGDFGYQPADFCDPCATGSYGYTPMGSGTVIHNDCGCDGGSEQAVPVPVSDNSVAAYRPVRTISAAPTTASTVIRRPNTAMGNVIMR